MMIPSNVNTIPGASTSASAMAAASSSRIPPYARADEPVDLEWQEEQNRTTGQPRLDGMVSLAREDSGTSYLGQLFFGSDMVDGTMRANGAADARHVHR